MNTQTDPQPLREKARAALAAQQADFAAYVAEQQAAEHARQLANLRRELDKSPELAGAIVDAATATATIDGLTFAGQSRRGLFLLSRCSLCGEPMSADIQNLIDLGNALPHLAEPEASGSPFDAWKDDAHRHYPRTERGAPPVPWPVSESEHAFIVSLRDLLFAWAAQDAD